MIFLTIGSIKDLFVSLPAAEQSKLMSESIQILIDLKKKKGEKFSFYHMPGVGRVVSIGDFDSFEEYDQSLQSAVAVAGYMNYEHYPLIEDDEKGLAAVLEYWKAKK